MTSWVALLRGVNVNGVTIIELVARAGNGQVAQPASWGEAALIR